MLFRSPRMSDEDDHKIHDEMVQDGSDTFYENGYVGIDIDKGVAFEDGLPSPDALEAIRACASYTELSQSNRAFHIICRGELPFGGRNNGKGWEIYRTKRYFVLTGNVLLYDAIADAQAKGIPIIGFDSGVPGAPEGAILANCATNNYNAGALAGEMIYAAIKDRIAAAEGTVRIGVSAQDAVSESVTQRGLGFIDKIGELAAADGYTVKLEGNEKYVNDAKVESVDDGKIVIETLVPSQVTAELSAIDCQNLLNKSDIIALYGSNQHSAEAMVTANENLQKLGTGEGQVIGAGFDSGAVIKAAVADGTFLGAITQAPFAMGEALVDTMVKAANGEEVSDIDTGCQWYTAENMNDDDIAINLYD